jgi:hypothetical protein
MRDHLIQVGEALYGPRFQRVLAEALDVNERTMRRWVAGTCEPPASLQSNLLHLALTRRATIEKIIRRLQ